MSFFPKLSNWDVFPKYRDDVKVRTVFGATVSVVSMILMTLLFFGELYDYMSISVEDHLIIDNTNTDTLPINFNVTFSRIPCSLVGIDVMDVGGNQLTISRQAIHKTPIDKDGNRISHSQKTELGTLKEHDVLSEAGKHGLKEDDNNENSNNNNSSKCGSCYGAETSSRKCCYTCDDIKNAYHDKGWGISDLSQFEQCKREGVDYSGEKEAMEHKEGCIVNGYLETKRGSGNFHFAPGHTFSASHAHMHDFGAFQAGSFDTSHIISHLSFGNDLRKSSISNPLDNSNHKSSFNGQSIFQYYAKVVPTRYNYMNGNYELTNQFSVTMHETKLKLKEGYGIPGVFFFYDFSPLMVEIKETRKPFFHFITQVCAIIGGIFTVTGLVDRFVHGAMKTIAKKKNLNKFG